MALTVVLAIAVSPVIAAVSGLHRPGDPRGARGVELGRDRAADHRDPRPRRLAARHDRVGVVRRHRDRARRSVRISTGSFTRALVGALLIVVVAAAFGLVISRLIDLDPVEELRHASHHLAWAFDLRLSLLVLFTLAWIAERFDTSALLAGFAAGVMVSLLGEPRRVADQLIGLGEGFFVPLFFVVLGARIDLRALVHSRDDLVLFAALALGTTLVPLAVAAIVRLPMTSGLLAAAEMGVPSAVASLGLASGALRPGQAAAIVGAAALSLAVTSVGAIRLGLNPRINPAHRTTRGEHERGAAADLGERDLRRFLGRRGVGIDRPPRRRTVRRPWWQPGDTRRGSTACTIASRARSPAPPSCENQVNPSASSSTGDGPSAKRTRRSSTTSMRRSTYVRGQNTGWKRRSRATAFAGVSRPPGSSTGTSRCAVIPASPVKICGSNASAVSSPYRSATATANARNSRWLWTATSCSAITSARCERSSSSKSGSKSPE